MNFPSLPESRVGILKHVHTDIRRSVMEWNGGDYSIQYFVIGEKRSALGNHYHTGKRETFTILSGGGYVATQRVDESGAPCGAVHQTLLKEGSVIVVDAYTAHAFVLDEGTTMINYSSAPFDPKNMDMNNIVLVDPDSLEIRVLEKA